MQIPKLRKSYTVVLIAALLILGGIFAAVAYTRSLNHKPAITASQSTKGEVENTPASSSSNSDVKAQSTGQPGDTKSNSSAGANTELLSPTGDFVSNHHPNLSGSPAPNTINSVCTTTPGAHCVISFTKDGVTKSLASQTTDRGGSAYWAWKLQDVGLTAGSWQIKATATLNGKTVSATDALALEVAQ